MQRTKSILSHLSSVRETPRSFYEAQPRRMSTVQSTVLSKQSNAVRVFMLNRPEQLNALSLDMINILGPKLLSCQSSEAVKCVVLTKQSGAKAFCAGGDVKRLFEIGMQTPQTSPEVLTEFFHEEYKLNHLIGTFKKPIVALMDGITMGGGAGISVHAPFRIATENTVFAMPETKIGLFPDVGGSFFLPRLDGEIGTYLGLTGKILKGKDVFMAGIATHYIPSDRLPQLIERLSDLETSSVEVVNQIIEDFSGDPIEKEEWQNWTLGGEALQTINSCFKYNSVMQIINALKENNSSFAEQTLADIYKGSPTSCKVTLAQLRKGAKLHLRDCFKMESTLSAHFLAKHDFYEGVRAALIDKDKAPKWNPSWENVESIPDVLIQKSYFAPVETVKALRFTNNDSYYDYPHRTLSSFPTEEDVKKVISGRWQIGKSNQPCTSRQQVIDIFKNNWGGYNENVISSGTPIGHSFIGGGDGRGKIGLVGRVESILERANLLPQTPTPSNIEQ